MTALPRDTDVVFMFDCADALGGVQRVTRRLADGLYDAGRHVAIVTLHPDQSPQRVPMRNAVPETIVTDRNVPMPYSPVPLSRRIRLLARGKTREIQHFDRGAENLRAVLRSLNDPLVVAMQTQSAEHAIAAGVPPERLVVQYHGAFETAVAGKEIPRIAYVARRARAFLVLNSGDAARFSERVRVGPSGAATVGWMRNPIDVPDVFVDEGERDNLIVAAGRFVPEKGYDLLIGAWALIADRHPRWRLEIRGAGPQEALLRSRAAEAGSSVTVAGPTDNLPGLLAKAAIHVLPSLHEGMGLVLAEAVCAGAANVAFDCSAGVRDLVIDQKTGLLAPVGDVPALADAIERLISDPAARNELVAGARDHIRAYATQRAIKRWGEFLDQARTEPLPTTSARRSRT